MWETLFCNKSKQIRLFLMKKYNLIQSYGSPLEADHKSRIFPEKSKNIDLNVFLVTLILFNFFFYLMSDNGSIK
jgi:hypothetical protein